ncbi:hypothetical protein SLA2020_341800 [Shorea laevis]
MCISRQTPSKQGWGRYDIRDFCFTSILSFASTFQTSKSTHLSLGFIAILKPRRRTGVLAGPDHERRTNKNKRTIMWAQNRITTWGPPENTQPRPREPNDRGASPRRTISRNVSSPAMPHSGCGPHFPLR